MSGSAAFDALARTLADAHARFGATAFANRRRLIGLLADHVPESKREIRAIGTAIDEGIPVALGGSERHLVGMEMDRLAERLEATTGLRIDIARQVVRAFAFALGLGPLPSVYVGSEPATPTPAPAPVQQTDDWRGVSEPNTPATNDLSSYLRPPPPATGSSDTFIIAGRSVSKNQLYLSIGGLVAVFGAMQLLDSGKSQPGPIVTPGPISSASGTATPPAQRLDYGQPVADNNYANETTDYAVPAKSTLENDVGTRTPMSIPGGRRITTAALQKLLMSDPSTVLVDVLDNQHGQTVRGAKFLPGVGNGGTVDDQFQPRLVSALAQLTGGNKARPVVFYCIGSMCWESYNALLRAAAAGYTNLYWYRGGIAAWGMAGLPMDPTPAPAG